MLPDGAAVPATAFLRSPCRTRGGVSDAGTASDELDPDEWAAAAELHLDSWWPDYAAWLVTRGGEQRWRLRNSAPADCHRWNPPRASTSMIGDGTHRRPRM